MWCTAPRSFTRDEETQLRALSETLIVKDVRSPERLFDETALFLHRVGGQAAGRQAQAAGEHPSVSPAIAGKKVLIVDDDVRNIFALTSALERHQMEILNAESGPEAIALLRATPDVDAVLMDIMMPEMDGFEVDPQASARTRGSRRCRSSP